MTMRVTAIRLTITLGAAALTAAAAAGTINVPGDAATIQAGIDDATDGDEVVVAVGTYNESIDFGGKAITVRSSDPRDPSVVMSTIIDGTGLGRVVLCITGEGPESILDGFVITGGVATTPPDDDMGGGMYIESSATVRNCIFTGNTASFGGAMYVHAGSLSTPTIENCTFIVNDGGGGGAVFLVGSSPNGLSFTNCIFEGNSALVTGGAFYVSSGAVHIEDCTFTGNTATDRGGAISNLGASHAVATGCTFVGNSAPNGGAFHNSGGGSGETMIVDCVIRGNSASSGGGLYNESGSNQTVGNTTICGNSPDQVGGEPYNDAGGNITGVYCPPPAPECPGDTDDNGTVDVADFLAFLANWGTCP